MNNTFEIIKITKEGGEYTYGIIDSSNNTNTYDTFCNCKTKVQNLIKKLNKLGDIEPIHIPNIIEDFLYEIC